MFISRTERGWVRFLARWILGLIFLMAGWWKCFTLTPLGHAAKYFTIPYADTWIPYALLLIVGVTIPVVELLAGALMLLGWRVREAGIALGVILILVTYGHLLKEPLYDTTHHIFPRTILLIIAFSIPRIEDTLSLDYFFESRR